MIQMINDSADSIQTIHLTIQTI